MENKKLVISEKASKSGLLDFINKSVDNVKALNANLAERMTYAVNMATKDLKKVTKDDLKELAQEVVEVLSAQVTPAPVPMENQVKPKLKKGDKKADKVEKPKQEEAPAEPVKEPAKEVKAPKNTKKADKETKAPEKKAEVETLKPISETKSIGLAKMFPAEINHADLGKLVAQHDMDFATFRDQINEGKTLYIATYWTKRLIKQFGYAEQNNVEVPKTGFPFDLDILLALVACEKVDRIWAMSSYTEAMYNFDGVDFEPVEDKDEKGNTYSVKVSSGMEFEIYAPADEVK